MMLMFPTTSNKLLGRKPAAIQGSVITDDTGLENCFKRKFLLISIESGTDCSANKCRIFIYKVTVNITITICANGNATNLRFEHGSVVIHFRDSLRFTDRTSVDKCTSVD